MQWIQTIYVVLKWFISNIKYKIRRSGMIPNKTARVLYQRQKGIEINSFKSLYGLRQWAKPIPHSIYKSHRNNNCKTIQTRNPTVHLPNNERKTNWWLFINDTFISLWMFLLKVKHHKALQAHAINKVLFSYFVYVVYYVELKTVLTKMHGLYSDIHVLV